MHALLKLSGLIDALTDRVGRATAWLVLAMTLISAANAIMRYAADISSNAYLEIQWYLFSAIFLLGAGYALKQNEHVRIDVLSGRLSPRARAWIDIFGTVFFLLPMALLLLVFSWPIFLNALESGEHSANAGGLLVWPVRALVPAGFALLILQAASELIKRIAFLAGRIDDPGRKRKESSEDELAAAIKAQR
ncbi:MAG: TRAP transporter small permease subunit, partial [Zoogloea sp.]|nr:TRAP transporter small permease subunit [Zoogloea sp.]